MCGLMVAGGSGVEAVYRFGGDGHRGVEAKCDVCAGNVIVNRLGQGDDIQTSLLKAMRVFLRPISSQADQTIEAQLFIISNGHLGHVHQLIPHGHFVWFVTAAPEKSAALGQDATDVDVLDGKDPVFDQSAEAILNPDHLPTVMHGGFADAAYHRV